MFWLFNSRHVFSGRHFGGLCQQTRFIVPVESAGANRVPIVPEDSGSCLNPIMTGSKAERPLVVWSIISLTIYEISIQTDEIIVGSHSNITGTFQAHFEHVTTTALSYHVQNIDSDESLFTE